MLRSTLVACSVAFCIGAGVPAAAAEQKYRRLSVAEYRDKMKAGWIGQMVAAAWGMPLEFQFNGDIVPESRVPHWDPPMINDTLTNDDVFRDTQLLYLLDKIGLAITPRQALVESALVWQPPGNQLLSGYYSRGRGAGFSILSADVVGLVSPGLPQSAISLSEQLSGRMSDLVYAGRWLDGMYAEAFFEKAPAKLVAAGLRMIPEDCRVSAAIRDVVRWHEENPRDWQKTWRLVQEKWRGVGFGWTVGGLPAGTPLPGAHVNTLYVVMGLLYGEGDLDRSITICIRGGDDTDTTAPSVGGVLFTTLGYSKLPEKFKAPIDPQTRLHYLFDNNAWHMRAKGVYTMEEVYAATERVARQVVVQAGGRIEKDKAGSEVFVLPVREPEPGKAITIDTDRGSEPAERLTVEELARLRGTGAAATKALQRWAPGWTLRGGCDLGVASEIYGKEGIVTTYPPDAKSACTLSKQIVVPGGDAQTMMQVVVANARGGAFTLAVKVDGQEAFVKHVYNRWSNASVKPWMHAFVDLTPWAGKSVKVELINRPDARWNYPWAYWSDILFETKAASSGPVSWKDKAAWLNSTNEGHDFQEK